MPSHGQLTDAGVIVEKPHDASRLHSKSQFGIPLSHNKLHLNFIEATFLTTEQKLIIHDSNNKRLSFQDLLQYASEQDIAFDSNYLIYRDLRKRGYTIQQYKLNKNITFLHQTKNKEDVTKFIKVFREHDDFDLKNTYILINQAIKKNALLWYGIVDEEGDLTYYNIDHFTPLGVIQSDNYGTCDGMLVNDRIIIFDKNILKNLHEIEFYGKPFGSGLQLSLIEALYLYDQKVLNLNTPNSNRITKSQIMKKYEKIYPDLNQRLRVYTDLKHHGLIVKTGFKFGAHFRAYTKKPENTHAEYLINVVPNSYRQRWAEISRAIRLAHSVNKDILFAHVKNKSVEYIKLGRLRP
jgi:tRNA-intron endonuclease